MRKTSALLVAFIGMGLVSAPAVAQVYPPVVVTTPPVVIVVQPPSPTFAPPTTTAPVTTSAPAANSGSSAGGSTGTTGGATTTVVATTTTAPAAPTTTIPTNVLPSASVQTPFTSGKAGLSKAFLAELKRFADVVKAANGKRVTIVGYSPSSKTLAKKRANDTKAALQKSLGKTVTYVVKTSVKKGNPKSVQVTFE